MTVFVMGGHGGPWVPLYGFQSSVAPPDMGASIGEDFRPGTWMQGSGLGNVGEFYLHLTAKELTLTFSATVIRGSTNNHPQGTSIFLCEPDDLSPAGDLMDLTDAHNGEAWYQVEKPIAPSNPYLMVENASVYDSGAWGADNGVKITVSFFEKGTLLYLACDDCGSNGHNPDGDYNDKYVKIWVPMVYGNDFGSINVRTAGSDGAKMIEFLPMISP